MHVTGFWSGVASTTLDTVGNTLTDALMLDTWADANVVAWDSSRSGKERAIAAAKGVGVAVVNLAGGEILGTAGKVLLKVPGAKNVVAKVAASAAGRLLATDVKVLASRAIATRAARTAAVRVTESMGGETIGEGVRMVEQSLSATRSVPKEPLDWSIVSKSGETREAHVALHEVDNLTRDIHGVFTEDAMTVANEAWDVAQANGLRPDIHGVVDVPMGRQVGWLGGKAGSQAAVPLTNVRLVVKPGTNKIITAFPLP